MSLAEKIILPTKGFNSQFSKIINCRIINPPYNENFADENFFLAKRFGITVLKEISGETIHDVIEYSDNNKTEFILSTETSTKVKVYKYDSSTDTLTNLLEKDKGVFFDFIKILGGGQAISDSGTATSGGATTLTDTGQGRTIDEFAGEYVFIKNGTGTGQLFTILSNTSDTLTVSGFDVNPDATSEYQIYELLVDNIIVSADDGVYKYDGVSFEKINDIANNPIDDMVFWKKRFWYANNGNLYFSEEGNNFDFDITSILNIGDKNIIKLYSYGDVLLVLTKTKIYSIRENIKTDDGSIFYSANELVSNTGIFSRDSIIFDKGLYLVASDKRFYAMSLEVVGTDYYARLEEQGSTVYNYLKELEQGTDELSITSDVNNIYIYNTTSSTPQEYVFNYLYEGWLVNNYSKPIKKKKILNNIMYIMGSGYLGYESGYVDGTTEYSQSIEVILGTDNLFKFKNWKYFNVLLGKSDYEQEGVMTLEWQITNKKYSETANLANATYLSDLYDAVQETMGAIPMGGELMGGDNELFEILSDIEVIQKPIDIAGIICKLKIDTNEGSGILFGGVHTMYVLMQGALNYYKNLI